MKAEQLRKSILQLAIQGKLVKQDPNDEPASVLLERIRAEKQRLIKEGKIKKDKGDSIIFKGDDNCHYEKIGSEVKNIDDEIPFEIPDNWCWVRFPQLVYFELGKTPDRQTDKFWNKGIYPWFSIADMQDKKTITETKDKISEIALQEKFNGSLSPKGTLLMSFKLTVGRTSILGVDAVHSEAIISIFPYVYDSNIIRNYLMNTLGLLVNYVEQTDAIKGATLNSSKLKSMFIPVPPLVEQERIVKEIERFEPLLTEYDKLEQQATKLDTEIYGKLKKSILQYAIQGKLVEQDETDEPASVLLERIRAEKKAQLGKKYVESYIYKGGDNCYYEKNGSAVKNITDEIPFDIPENWSVCRLKNICSKIVDGDHNPPKGVDSITNYLMLSSQNINHDKIVSLDKVRYLTEDVFKIENDRTNLCVGDILFTSVGTLGRTCIYKGGLNLCFQRSVSVITTYINNDYLKLFLDSPHFQSKVVKEATGTAQKGFYLNQLENSIIVVPPINEQLRIVKEVKTIFSKIKDGS
ncbi:MAG: restriction endonuclease subunit S [Clostridia bacterium]|nr:restriction endonuclease subunit S [Clostridia bacterium]